MIGHWFLVLLPRPICLHIRFQVGGSGAWHNTPVVEPKKKKKEKSHCLCIRFEIISSRVRFSRKIVKFDFITSYAFCFQIFFSCIALIFFHPSLLRLNYVCFLMTSPIAKIYATLSLYSFQVRFVAAALGKVLSFCQVFQTE